MKTTSVRQCSRNSQPRAFARAIALITALCALAFANFATAATLTQTGDWNVSSNWDTELVPTSADTVYINSSRIATIDSDDSGEADVLRVGYGENQNGTLNVDGSLTTVGDMTVGYTPQWMAPSTGTLNLGDTGAIDIGGGLTLGLQHAGGTFNQGANTSVSVGGNLTVSETGGGHTSTYTVPITGTLTLTGVASELRIAYGDGGNGTFTYNSTVDTLVVPGSVTVGRANNWQGPASGTFNLGDNTKVTIGDDLKLGENHASGTFNQGSNTSVSVGGILTVGGVGGASTSSAYTVPTTGTLTLASDLRIAYGDGGNGTFTYNNPNETLNVPGSVTVARAFNWQGPTYGGTFNQDANTAVTIGDALTIGGAESARDGSDGGVYNLATGASLTVTGATTVATDIRSRGRLNIDVGDSASGLIVGTSLTVGTDGLIDITFTEDPLSALLGTVDNHTDIHYGLIWAGDHATTLTDLGTKLTWDDTNYLTGDFDEAVSIFYDSGTAATYVGFYISIIPEPASLALLTLGTAWLLNRRRGRRHDN